MPAVITPQDDDGVLRHAVLLERLHDPPDLGVDEARARAIATHEAAGELRREGTLIGYVEVGPQLLRVMERHRWRARWRAPLYDAVSPLVQVPIPLRRDEGQMRLQEPHR